MPTYLRRFYITKLTEYKKQETEQVKKVQKKSNISKPGITNPRFKR